MTKLKKRKLAITLLKEIKSLNLEITLHGVFIALSPPERIPNNVLYKMMLCQDELLELIKNESKT